MSNTAWCVAGALCLALYIYLEKKFVERTCETSYWEGYRDGLLQGQTPGGSTPFVRDKGDMGGPL